MKTLTWFMLLLLSHNALALRCGNDLVDEGDNIGKVMQSCDVDSVYQVNNNNADITKIYTKQGGMNYEITTVDGKVQSIEGSRF